ncbi:MAG: ABC transporter permease subunit [Bacteroidetes bacterium]|nr:ABC transporter permease subunit [Bacteroidota bacterium]
MLNTIFHLAKKDLLLFVADKRAIALTFLLPVAMITIFYFAFGGSPQDGNNPVVALIMSDLDSTEASQRFIGELDSLKGLRLDQATSEAGSRNAVAEGKRAAALIIHPGFGDSLALGSSLPLEVLYDSGRPMEFGIISQLLYAAVGNFAGESQGKARAKKQMMETFGMDEVTVEGLMAQMSGSGGDAQPAPPFSVREVVGERDNDFSLIQAVAGTAVMLLLFSVAGMGSGLLMEREAGTLKKLLYAPISPISILGGKFASTLLLSVAQLVLMFVFAALAFGLDLSRNLPALGLMIVATAAVCASLGMLLASVSRTRKQLDGFSTILILTMSAIGGSMMPVVFMPVLFQKLAVGTVNHWSIQGFYDIYWRNLPISAVLDNAGVLFGLAALMMAISAYFFKRNLVRLL